MCVICEHTANYNKTNQNISLDDYLKEKLEGTAYLNCSFCSTVSKIPNITGLAELRCYWCPRLKEIPNIIGLEELYCYCCFELRVIPDIINLYILDCYDCPRLFYSPKHQENKIKIDKLRKFIRNNYKYFVFRRLIKSREFCEHYYSPENKIGKMVKVELEHFVSSI
jgi:hypothetical protein